MPLLKRRSKCGLLIGYWARALWRGTDRAWPLGVVPLAALALAGFTVATNFVFHEFRTMDGEQAALELSLFLKNISIAGALVLLAGMSVKTKDGFPK